MSAGTKILDVSGKIVLKNIVSEYHCYIIGTYKSFSENKSVSEASRDALHLEIEANIMPLKNSAKKIHEGTAVLRRNDHQNFFYPALDERIERIENHLAVVHWQKLFRSRRREGKQSCRRSSGENNAFHFVHMDYIE